MATTVPAEDTEKRPLVLAPDPSRGTARASGLIILGISLFFAQGAFHIYTAALPLYFSNLGFDATMVGLLIGAAGLAELAAAFVVGPSIDRFGARVLLITGGACYIAASLGYVWLTLVPALVVLRGFQGFGVASLMPAAYSYVPWLVQPRRHTVAFASLGIFSNVAMAVCPLLGLLLLEGAGPNAVFATAAVGAALGLAISQTVPSPRSTRRPFSLTFHSSWLPLLVIAISIIVQWGVLMAFVPIEAHNAGSNSGVMFTADAIAVLASRVPAGWIADRYGALRLTLLGIVSTIAAVLVLLFPITDSTLVLSGVLNGLGGGLILPPLLAQLSRRSTAETRGTALAYFNVAFAIGMASGSGLGGLLFPWLGFNGLLILGAAIAASSVAVALSDPLLRVPAHALDAE